MEVPGMGADIVGLLAGEPRVGVGGFLGASAGGAIDFSSEVRTDILSSRCMWLLPIAAATVEAVTT